jgi:hypothetical protein
VRCLIIYYVFGSVVVLIGWENCGRGIWVFVTQQLILAYNTIKS